MAAELPIIEQIRAGIKATIAAIAPPDYHGRYECIGWRKTGISPKNNLVVLWQGDPEKRTVMLGNPLVEWLQPFAAVCFIIEAEDSTRDLDERLNIARSDIEKALRANKYLGLSATTGPVIDTIIEPCTYVEPNGTPAVAVNFIVHYRTRYANPYSTSSDT